MEVPSKSDWSTCFHSSKSRLILSLAAWYPKAGSERGQHVERERQETWWFREGERERERDLSSSQIKRRAGLAAITLLIGPHLFASRGAGSGRQECASWQPNHLHPWCIPVISHPQFLSFSLSLFHLHPPGLVLPPFPASHPFVSLKASSCIPGIFFSLYPSLLLTLSPFFSDLIPL